MRRKAIFLGQQMHTSDAEVLNELFLQGLAKLLADSAPQSFKETQFDSYFGRKIAVDASMHIYQFLVAPSPDALGSIRSYVQRHSHSDIQGWGLGSRREIKYAQQL